MNSSTVADHVRRYGIRPTNVACAVYVPPKRRKVEAPSSRSVPHNPEHADRDEDGYDDDDREDSNPWPPPSGHDHDEDKDEDGYDDDDRDDPNPPSGHDHDEDKDEDGYDDDDRDDPNPPSGHDHDEDKDEDGYDDDDRDDPNPPSGHDHDEDDDEGGYDVDVYERPPSPSPPSNSAVLARSLLRVVNSSNATKSGMMTVCRAFKEATPSSAQGSDLEENKIGIYISL
jgi:hypothetical protein